MLSTTTIDNLLLIVIFTVYQWPRRVFKIRYFYYFVDTLCWFFSQRGDHFCWNFTSDRTHKNILPHPRRRGACNNKNNNNNGDDNHNARGNNKSWMGVGGWHQVPQEHLILISFAPTLWPTTWRSGISDRIRSQSVLCLSGRNTQKAVNAGGARGSVRLKQTESARAGGERGGNVVGRVNSLGASFLWAN